MYFILNFLYARKVYVNIMKKNVKQINLDSKYMEDIRYITDSLPISYCYDYYDSLINNEIPFHWHNEFEFLTVTSGEIVCQMIHMNGTKLTRRIHEGEGTFFNTKTLHCMKSSYPGTESRTLSLPENFFNFQQSGSIYKNIIEPVKLSSLPGVFFTADRTENIECMEKLRNLYDIPVSDPCWELYCIETICCAWRNLLDILNRTKTDTLSQSSIKENRLWIMLKYIHENYANELTISDIASSANISKSECFRCFNSVMKQTPLDYLTDYRLARAASLLIETNTPVSSIAAECGFNNSSYFGSVFRKKFGTSPGKYRIKFETTKKYIY